MLRLMPPGPHSRKGKDSESVITWRRREWVKRELMKRERERVGEERERVGEERESG